MNNNFLLKSFSQLKSQKLGEGFEGAGIFMKRENVNSQETLGTTFEQYASTIFGFLTLVAGLAFLLYFALGAIQWIISGGDPQKIEKAKGQMTSAAIGLIAVIAAFTIAGIISLVLGIDILNPANVLNSINPQN